MTSIIEGVEHRDKGCRFGFGSRSSGFASGGCEREIKCKFHKSDAAWSRHGVCLECKTLDHGRPESVEANPPKYAAAWALFALRLVLS